MATKYYKLINSFDNSGFEFEVCDCCQQLMPVVSNWYDKFQVGDTLVEYDRWGELLRTADLVMMGWYDVEADTTTPYVCGLNWR